MDRRFITIILVVVLGLGGLFWFTNHKKPAQPGSSNSAVDASSHIQGAGNKGVTLVEYGDFQCPVCFRYFPMVEAVREKYGDDISFQYRNFPLSSIHPKAFSAHRAAEAAGMQNKFFEMYKLLYTRQQTWVAADNATKIFEQYAQELGLNADKFRQDFASDQVNKIVNADVKAAQDLGANGTPTFILNGQKIENPRDQESFYKVIDDAIAERSQSQGQNQ